ncbi:MAG: hemerythrin domain-containing protein [Verrucomicrobia bacterium]|nr:hemerythrin domain-containing protein [Verrucomicrobiota bacterium]
MRITDILTIEHALFRTMFDQIEQTLPELTTFTEIQPLARMMSLLLRNHGEAEQNLLYATLDHMLKEKGHFGRLFTEHREMDARMEQVQQAIVIAEARRLFQETMVQAREHFLYEERKIFPLAEKHLQNESLEKLGELWMQKHTSIGR